MVAVRLQLLISGMFWVMCWNGKAKGQGTPTATTLIYDETIRSFTCTSTGGPATNVTWRKNGAVITINATYQQRQVVTNSSTGTYETVLTIAQSVTDVSGRYSCTIRNSRGTSAIEGTVSSLHVFIMQESTPTAGQPHTFTCTVTPQGELTRTPTVQWIYPIAIGQNFTVSSTPPYTFTINALHQSQDGQYTCQATLGSVSGTGSATLHVEVPPVSVMIIPIGIPMVGQSYSLRCSVSGTDFLSPAITYHWYNESSNPRSQLATTNLYTFTHLQPYHDGQYTCEVIVVSIYLNEDITRSTMQEIAVHRLQLTPPGGTTRKYTNNSIVTITDIGTGSAALLCTTTKPGCCSSRNPETQWYFPNGSAVPNRASAEYYRTRNNLDFGDRTSPRSVQLHRNPGGTLSGIFHCDIPDASGVQAIFVGIYDSNTGAPTATMLTYNETTRSLTCISTGGPATIVTWRKNAAVITINATYQQTQVVTSSSSGTYETVLTISHSVTDISGIYSCTVENTRGTSAIEGTVSLLQVFITAGANPTIRQSYTFICTVTPQRGVTGIPTVQWMGPGSSDPIATGGDFTVSNTPPYTLTINPLRQSQDGQYTCQATVGTATATSSATLRVKVPSVSVVITPVGTPVAGQSYSLSCSVHGADSLSSTTTTYHWYNESNNPRSLVATTNVYTLTRLQPYHDGNYTCEVTVASPYLNGDFNQSATQEIIAQIPPVSVVITLVGTPVVDQSYSLSCFVHGADSLSPTTTTYRWYNESNNPRSLVATTNVYTLTRLQPYHDGNYTCEVTVVSPYLNGDFNWSAMQEIIVQNPPLPIAPTITLGITTPTSVVVSWSQQAPVDSYEISFQRATGNQQLGDCMSFQHNGNVSVGGNVTMFNLTGLQEFSTYLIVVTAVNVAGKNGSNPIAVNTQSAASSGGPEMLREVNITSTSITIAWDAINCVDRNGNITGYEVHYVPSPSHGNGSVMAAGTGAAGSILTIDGLTPSTYYFIQVAAVNSDRALGQLSAAIIVQTAPGLVATQTLGGGSLPVFGTVVGVCFSTALLYTTVLLVVKFTLVLRNKRRHRSEIEMKECVAYREVAKSVRNDTEDGIYENP